MYKYVISSISMYSNCSFLEKAFIVENVLMHIILMFPSLKKKKKKKCDI